MYKHLWQKKSNLFVSLMYWVILFWWIKILWSSTDWYLSFESRWTPKSIWNCHPGRQKMCNTIGVCNSAPVSIAALSINVEEPGKVHRNWNTLLCGAHVIYLSVKKLFTHPKLCKPLEKIRKTVNYFLRSSLTCNYLTKAFKESPNFKRAIRLLLYVKTW